MKKVYLEITNVCNLDCEFCPKTGRTPQFMTVEQLDYLLGKVAVFSNNVFFHVMGEPLLHPQLEKLLDVANKHKMNVNITTNGTLIKAQSDVLLNAKALRKINISLHSLDVQGVMAFQIELQKKNCVKNVATKSFKAISPSR